MAQLLKVRLLARGYPERLIDKTTATVPYEARAQLLNLSKPPPPKFYPPVYRCLLPPQYKLLKFLVLENYSCLQNMVPSPRFVTLRHKTLKNELVQSKISPTDDQMIDIYLSINGQEVFTHTVAGQLPTLRTDSARTKQCRHPRCATCRHLNCSKFIKCTRTGIIYTIRHSFSCTSSNLIYVITCKKCQKQYVGLTTKQLNVRINHHRTNIFNNKSIYISRHFNLPDHTIEDLSVQAIDRTLGDISNPLQELRKLERYWIKALRTLQPMGLNVSAGSLPTAAQ